MTDEPTPPENPPIDDEQGWIRLELLSEQPEFDGATLMKMDALGIEVRDGTTFMEDAFGQESDARSRLIAYFDDDQPTAELRRRVQSALSEVEVVSISSYVDRSWETSWMKYFEATHLSPRVAVGPPWDAPEVGSAPVVMIIEPGMAFGTGTHETTRLCAQLIDELSDRRDFATMLDVGCGSAILSMAASGLGIPKVVGIDIDATAVDVARDNIATNGYGADQIELSTTPLADIAAPHELVVANILANILLALRDDLWRVTAPGGQLLLSGIGVHQVDDMRQAFEHQDFTLVDTRQDGEWVALRYRRAD